MQLFVAGWEHGDDVRQYDLSSILSELSCAMGQTDDGSDNRNGDQALKDIQCSIIMTMNSEMILLYISSMTFYGVVHKDRFIYPIFRVDDNVIKHDNVIYSNIYYDWTNYINSIHNNDLMYLHCSDHLNVIIDKDNHFYLFDSNHPRDSVRIIDNHSTKLRSTESHLNSSSSQSRSSSSSPLWLVDSKLLVEKRIVKVTCSDDHVIIMSDSNCYSYGASQYGQLGIGEVSNNIMIYSLV